MIRKKFNEDYFEVIDTPEKAYLLGFIFGVLLIKIVFLNMF